MDISPDFFAKFKTLYDSKKLTEARELIFDLFKAVYPVEMNEAPVEKDTIDMYLDVLAEQKIDLKTSADLDLFLLEPVRQKLFGIEDEDDENWDF